MGILLQIYRQRVPCYPPRDSLSSRGLIRESRRVGFAMNSSDSMKAILYFALGGSFPTGG